MTDLEKAETLINQIEIAEYFAFMKSKIGENAMLNQLQKKFILGKNDEDFYDQLKSLAHLLFNTDNTSNKSNEKPTEVRNIKQGKGSQYFEDNNGTININPKK
jgi:hypothetical protein